MDLALDSEPPANHDLMMWAPTVKYNANLLEPRRAAIIEWEPVEGAVTFELQWRCVPPTDPPGNPGPDAEWTSTAKSRALTGNRTIKLLATEVSGFPAGHRVAFRVRACTAANRWGPFSPASIDIKTPAADRPVEQSAVARRAVALLAAAPPPSAEDVAAAETPPSPPPPNGSSGTPIAPSPTPPPPRSATSPTPSKPSPPRASRNLRDLCRDVLSYGVG